MLRPHSEARCDSPVQAGVRSGGDRLALQGSRVKPDFEAVAAVAGPLRIVPEAGVLSMLLKGTGRIIKIRISHGGLRVLSVRVSGAAPRRERRARRLKAPVSVAPMSSANRLAPACRASAGALESGRKLVDLPWRLIIYPRSILVYRRGVGIPRPENLSANVGPAR